MGLTAKQKIEKQSSFGDIISVRSEFDQNLLASNQVDSNGLPKLKTMIKGQSMFSKGTKKIDDFN